jgi:hypothetical protein
MILDILTSWASSRIDIDDELVQEASADDAMLAAWKVWRA